MYRSHDRKLTVLPPWVWQGLVLRASQHPEGKIVEPTTGEVFGWEDLKKVRNRLRALQAVASLLTPCASQVFIS